MSGAEDDSLKDVHLRYWSCWRKRKYVTRAEAKEKAKELIRYERRKGLKPYKCWFCIYWHIGHPIGSKGNGRDDKEGTPGSKDEGKDT